MDLLKTSSGSHSQVVPALLSSRDAWKGFGVTLCLFCHGRRAPGMSIKSSFFLLQPMEHPGCFPHPSACPCLPKMRGTETGTSLATIQMEKLATFTLETAVQWLTALTGEQICRKSPWDGRKRSKIPILVQLGETETPLEMALLVSCSLSQCSASLPSVLAPAAGILILQCF